MNALENKVALVLGASKGIGLGIAQVFSAKGAKVIIAARDNSSLEKATLD